MQGKKIGYIRVSTLDQRTQRQLDSIHLDKCFTDKASGKDSNRPQLQDLLDYIREGDTLLVHSMDRLARNLDDLRALVQQLIEKKVRVEFLKEQLVFTGDDQPISKLLLSVMGAFSEFERALIKERQMEGIALAKRRGVYRGRKKKLSSEQVESMKKLLNQGKTKSAIARAFGISRDTLYRYLRLQEPEC